MLKRPECVVARTRRAKRGHRASCSVTAGAGETHVLSERGDGRARRLRRRVRLAGLRFWSALRVRDEDAASLDFGPTRRVKALSFVQAHSQARNQTE